MRRAASAATPPPSEPALPESEKGAPPPKLKSVLVVPDGPREQTDASKKLEKAPLPRRAPHPKPLPIQARRHLYSEVIERGECSRVNAAQDAPV